MIVALLLSLLLLTNGLASPAPQEETQEPHGEEEATTTETTTATSETNGSTEGEGETATTAAGGSCCPDGWLAYERSCYFFKRRKMRYSDAQKFCHENLATLMVVSEQDEMDQVLQHATWNQMTWIGLSAKFIPDSSALSWQTTGGMHFHELPWLAPKAPNYGRAGLLACGAFFNPMSTVVRSYIHFYDCNLPYYFVCERNETALDMKDAVMGVVEKNRQPWKDKEEMFEEVIKRLMGERIEAPTTLSPNVHSHHNYLGSYIRTQRGGAYGSFGGTGSYGRGRRRR